MKVMKVSVFSQEKVMYSSTLINRMNNKIFSCVWTMDFMVGGGQGEVERNLKLAQEYECELSMTFKFHTKKRRIWARINNPGQNVCG